ncbi:hypothetical protein ACFW1M_37525 [Streptomyces inhibens]|uniref:hypothetical protein n=1 Tax=Streptomyces inhibens TaxID=2293571 RepID=UPI0036B5D9E6
MSELPSVPQPASSVMTLLGSLVVSASAAQGSTGLRACLFDQVIRRGISMRRVLTR